MLKICFDAVIDKENLIFDPFEMLVLRIGSNSDRVFLFVVLREGFEGVVLGGFKDFSKLDVPVFEDDLCDFLLVDGNGCFEERHQQSY